MYFCDMPPTIVLLKKDKRSKKKRQSDFLTAFVDLVSITRACKKAKIPRQTIYDWKKSDKEFNENYEEAAKLALEALEDEAIRRAHEGVSKPVYHSGEKVGTVKEYSDTLMIFLLKARDPEKYRERSNVVLQKGKGVSEFLLEE